MRSVIDSFRSGITGRMHRINMIWIKWVELTKTHKKMKNTQKNRGMLIKTCKKIKKQVKNRANIKNSYIFVEKYLKKWQNLDLVL
jgi:hypothetical protein